MHKQEKAFFFALAWKSPAARRLIDILKNSEGKVKLYRNSCGHKNIIIVNGKPKCVKENRFIDYKELSITNRERFEFGEVISYYKRSFWLRSQIFTSGGRSQIKYTPIKS